MRILLALLVAVATPVHAEEFLSIKPVVEPNRPRNAVWKPLISFALPGFGQYWEQQWVSGGVYTGIGVGGLALASSAAAEISKADTQNNDLHEQSELQRQYTYGMQLYMFAGEMSAYHTFRTAVLTRQPQGDYTFIKNKEDSLDVMFSPFDYEHILRPTTFVPLLVLAAVGFAGLHEDSYLDGGDSVFTAGVSYNAGVGEEAMFRGYLFPVFRQAFDSYWWSNGLQAAIFGAMHYSSYNQFPIAQTVMGFYLGWMTHRNGYSIRESAFLHTWWDVLAIGFLIADQNGKNSKKAAKTVPLINFSF
jgi:hypothetical protein